MPTVIAIEPTESHDTGVIAHELRHTLGTRLWGWADGSDYMPMRRVQENPLSNGKQSGPRIGMQKGPLTGLGTGLSR